MTTAAVAAAAAPTHASNRTLSQAGRIGWAVSTYYDRPQHIAQMMQRAMTQDFSWERSAVAYEEIYARAMANKARL